jgi:hypothetical protein
MPGLSASYRSLQVHLDDDSCAEVTAQRGSSGDVQRSAELIFTERKRPLRRVAMIRPRPDEALPEAIRDIETPVVACAFLATSGRHAAARIVAIAAIVAELPNRGLCLD